MGPAAAAARTLELPAECERRVAQFLRQVDETDMVWLDEIYGEAVRMFVRYPRTPLGPGPHRPPSALVPSSSPLSPSSNYSEELELMPKTPSQKKRQRRKRLSALQEEEQEPGRKR